LVCLGLHAAALTIATAITSGIVVFPTNSGSSRPTQGLPDQLGADSQSAVSESTSARDIGGGGDAASAAEQTSRFSDMAARRHVEATHSSTTVAPEWN
jgi:hypothetical protein